MATWTPESAFMQAAIEEALKGAGRTHPNPSVGAVVVNGGQIVGRGFHEGPGHPHAEIVALGEAGSLAKGADLYVTLEPCCTTGRTGPCTEALLASGISRVAASVRDPIPGVNGAGISALEASGILVSVGLMEEEGRGVDPAYHTFHGLGRPHVHLKWAQTLDGRVVLAHGGYITGPQARLKVHEERFLADAILVSGATVAADDPLLTVRLDGRPKPLVRILLDNRSILTGGERVFGTCPEGGEIWVIRPSRSPLPGFAGRPGVSVIELATDGGGRFPLRDLLSVLHGRGIMGLFVEAVGRLAASFFGDDLVDRVSVHIAPLLAGTGIGPAAIEGPVRMQGGARVLENPRWERAGGDWVVTADLEAPCSRD